MRMNFLIVFILLMFYTCDKSKTNQNILYFNKENQYNEANDTGPVPHLKDTLLITTDAIIALRPDELRFQYFLDSGNETVYEADSDFGFSIYTAFNDFVSKRVSEHITQRRYLNIINCFDCPQIIDRDTINYGIICVSKKKSTVILESIMPADATIDFLNNYFKD